MKKKLPKKSKKNIVATRYLFVFFSALFVLVFGSFFVVTQQPPCANSISCIKDLGGKYDSSAKAGEFMGMKVSPPGYIARSSLPKFVLGDSNEEKHIFVNLINQTLYAYEGNRLIYEFPVSTGKWWETPTGDFTIWYKIKYTRMSGGSGNTYYNLPNVPFTMFFYNEDVPQARGFAIHGAYWHNNFGYPMSHGCINMRIEDAEKLFAWADPPVPDHSLRASKDNPGTKVTVYGETPKD